MIQPVAHAGVWRSIKHLYLGAAALFLITVGLGVLNVLTTGAIPFGQRLAHLHAGSIGWITLSVIATALWAFTDQRTVSERYAQATASFVWLSLATVAGYVASFYLAFNGQGPFWLLPLFGIPAALVIWAAALYTLAQLRAQPVLTTAHLLLSGALLVAALAATMGVLRGLTYASSLSLYPAGAAVDQVGAHAGPMDMYLALAFAGIVELLVRPDPRQRWTRWGAGQAILGVLGGLFVLASLYLGIEPLIGLGTLCFVASVAIYLARMGWRPFTRNPLASARNAGVAWGGLAFPIYVGLFLFLVFSYFIPGEPVPHALEVTFAHVTFVGLATNLLLVTHSSYVPPGEGPSRTELAGLWLLDLGLLAFIAGEFAAQRPDGALIMALGALLALGPIVGRMLAAQGPPPVAPHRA